MFPSFVHRAVRGEQQLLVATIGYAMQTAAGGIGAGIPGMFCRFTILSHGIYGNEDGTPTWPLSARSGLIPAPIYSGPRTIVLSYSLRNVTRKQSTCS